MSYNPLTQLAGGVLDTAPVNGIIAVLNGVLAGFANCISLPCSGAVTLTASDQDVTGCTSTFSVAGSNAFALVIGCFDFQVSTASAGTRCNGLLNVDGSDQTAGCLYDMNAVARGSATQAWIIPLGSGSHTLKLVAKKTGAGGVAAVQSGGTTITILLVDVP